MSEIDPWYTRAPRMRLILAVIIWAVAVGSVVPFVIGRWQPPPAITELGRQIDAQLNLTFWLTGFIFLAAQLILGYAVFRFGQRRSDPAGGSRGNDRWEALWTTGALVLFVGLTLVSYSAWAEARFEDSQSAAPAEDRLVVEVVGQQFVWNIRYAGADGVFGPTDVNLVDDALGNPLGVDRDHPNGADDIVVPRMAVPVNREVEVILKSKDVLHSFFVPELRIKLDTVPGLELKLRFTADTKGTYEIACAELCGLGHYRMRSYLEVLEPAAYEAWLVEQASYLE